MKSSPRSGSVRTLPWERARLACAGEGGLWPDKDWLGRAGRPKPQRANRGARGPRSQTPAYFASLEATTLRAWPSNVTFTAAFT